MRYGLAASILWLSGCSGMFGFGSGRAVERELGEYATLRIPKRLDPRGAKEEPHAVLFPFERIAGGFSAMGSFTPVREKFAIVVWPRDGADGSDAARRSAADRTTGIAWRTENGFEIGEGTHEVNLLVNPAWVVARRVPGRPVALAYMTWKKDSTLDEALAVLKTAEQSLKPRLDEAEFFTIVRDRPAAERNRRWAAIQALLAPRGVQVEAGGPCIEKDGVFYELTHNMGNDSGRRLTTFYALGTLPRAPGFRHLRPPTPGSRSFWPSMKWFTFEDGRWSSHSIDGDVPVPPRMAERLKSRHADKSLAYFYTTEAQLIDDLEAGEESLSSFYRDLGPMKKAFDEGRLIAAQ